MLLCYPLFIEVVILWECICVADFNPYCAKVISGKMKGAGYFNTYKA